MKKIIYGIGAVAAVVTPVVAVVSCGPSSNTNETAEVFTQEKLNQWADAKGKEFGWDEVFINFVKQSVLFQKESTTDYDRGIKQGFFNNSRHIPEGFTIPEGVTCIGDNAFENAILPKSFKIPDSVKFLGFYAFKGATFQGDFSLQDSQLTINTHCFEGVVLPENFQLPQNTRNVDLFAFSQATINANFKLPENLDSINFHSFGETKLPLGFKIPSSTKNITSDAFSNCILPADTKWSLGSPKAGSEVVAVQP